MNWGLLGEYATVIVVVAWVVGAWRVARIERERDE